MRHDGLRGPDARIRKHVPPVSCQSGAVSACDMSTRHDDIRAGLQFGQHGAQDGFIMLQIAVHDRDPGALDENSLDHGR